MFRSAPTATPRPPQERSLAEVEALPEAYLETIREELYQYATFIEWSIKQLEDFKPDVVILAQVRVPQARKAAAPALVCTAV